MAYPVACCRQMSRIMPFTPSNYPGLLSWFDFSVLSSLFQDAAGTTPVVSAADPIGRANNLAPGVTDYISQGTAGARPTSNTYLSTGLRGAIFDGGDKLGSSLAASNFAYLHDGTGFTSFTRFYLTSNDPTTFYVLWDTSNLNGSAIGFVAWTDGRSGTVDTLRLQWGNGTGSPPPQVQTVANVVPSNSVDVVLTVRGRREGGTNYLHARINGTEVVNTSNSAAVSSSNPAATLFFGGRSSDASGALVGGILRDYKYAGWMADSNVAAVEAGIR